MQIILASTSPYRRSMLARLGISFDQVDPQVDEQLWQTSDLSPKHIALRLAEEKAKVVSSSHPDAIVIAGDQVLEFEGEPLGKPGSKENHKAQLLRLSGKQHQLLTAVCVRRNETSRSFLNQTTLQMRNLTLEEIERSIEFDRAYDCAGGYKVESQGIALFSSIDSTDFTAIEGLPLMELSQVLRDYGLTIP